MTRLKVTLDESDSDSILGEARGPPAPSRMAPTRARSRHFQGKSLSGNICFQERRRPIVLKDTLRIKRIADGAESIESRIEGCQFVSLQRADLSPVRAGMEQS